MKKLLLLICLVIGSFSVNAQLSCADAIELTASGTYTVAIISGENPTSVCFDDEVDINGDPMQSDWYVYTALADGAVSVIADGTTNTSISVFVGTCDALECYDNTGLNGGAELSFPVEAGVTYYIGFDSFFSAESFSFDFIIGTCSAPSILPATDISFSSATLNWEVAPGNPLQYEVLYGLIDFPLEQGITATTFTNSLSLTGLNPSGNYDYYIRSVCGGTDKSLWIGPFELVLLKTVPFATGYDTLDETAGLRVSGAFNDTFFIDFTDGNAQSPDVYWVFNNTETEAVNNWIFTPAISLTAGQVINTSFYVYTTSPTANRSLRVTMGTSRAAIDQSTTIYSNTSLNANATGDYEQITSPDFIVPTTGIYYIGINDFSPANAVPTSMFFDTFSVNTGTLGTNDFVANQFSVFPNPVKNIVSITNASDINVSAIAITDLNGRIVKKQSFNNISNISMNVSDLAAGVYMMNITSDKGTATKKIIKN